jgi:proteasome accessory factor B
MSRLHELLREGRSPNCSTVAREFEVAPKTIQRDIDFMRDRLGLPIEFDPPRHGYRYTRPVRQLPLATITEGELVALLVAQKAIEQYKGTAFEAPLVAAFDKLSRCMDEPVTLALGAARAAIAFKPIGAAHADLALFQRMSEAVLHSVEVRFDYRSLRSGTPERRHVQPWNLCCVDNQWYVIGRDLARGAKRTFALPRIQNAELLGRRFTKPAGFSIRGHLGGAFGIITGPGRHAVRLRFEGWAARFVRERFWHESQRFRDAPDGAVEMELRLGRFEEVERWITSFGAHVTVLGPEALRARVLAAGRALVRRHQPQRRRIRRR